MNKEQYMYIATCRCCTSCVSNTSRRASQKKVCVAQKMLHISISQSQDPPANDDMYICVSAANGKTSDISVIQSPGLSTPFHFAFQWPKRHFPTIIRSAFGPAAFDPENEAMMN